MARANKLAEEHTANALRIAQLKEQTRIVIAKSKQLLTKPVYGSGKSS